MALDLQFGLVHDCVRACIYADHIARTNPLERAWLSLLDICYADAVLSWSQLFGTNSEPAHWKRFLEKVVSLKLPLEPFSTAMLTEKMSISRSDYDRFWRQMQDTRNKQLAHLELPKPASELPNITLALQPCCRYREWLLQFAAVISPANRDPDRRPETEAEMLAEFKAQITEICRPPRPPT